MAKPGPNFRSAWHREARLLRMKGLENRDIAKQLGQRLEAVKHVCRGIKPGADLKKSEERLLRDYGIRVTHVERTSWSEKGGQPYKVLIPVSLLSITQYNPEVVEVRP